MKRLFSLFLLLALASSPAVATTGKIEGMVVDEHDVPLKEIVVAAFPLDKDVVVGINQAVTDERGRFVITVVVGRLPNGRTYGRCWSVYPHQERGNYPDLASPFYGTDSNHAETVYLTLSHPEAFVTLKLGSKAGVLKGKVTDARTGAPLRPYFEFVWAKDPANKLGEETTDEYRILLPANTDITFDVRAAGDEGTAYKPYTYPGAINVGLGQEMSLDIQLEPWPPKNK